MGRREITRLPASSLAVSSQIRGSSSRVRGYTLAHASSFQSRRSQAFPSGSGLSPSSTSACRARTRPSVAVLSSHQADDPVCVAFCRVPLRVPIGECAETAPACTASSATLCYRGHVLMENRSGLVVGAVVSHADGFAERASALRLLDCVPGRHAKTVGADKAYDTRDFVGNCRVRHVTPHVARCDDRWGGSAIDGRTSRHAG